MPACDFADADCASAVCSASSGVPSTNPAPNTGVGMRKIALLAFTAAAKFGCVMLQPGASLRPEITNRSWTPPSGVPSGLLMKRTSRTGPFLVINGGTVFFAPSSVATATCGLVKGLEPPTSGCAWQPEQLFMLKRGPRPAPSSPAIVPDTESISWNVSLEFAKKACSAAFSPGNAPPAPDAPPRTPGSWAAEPAVFVGGVCASVDCDHA